MSKLTYQKKIDLVTSRLPSLDFKPSEEQLDFILHPFSQPCYLNACPGSGKTEVVGIKAAYEIAAWKEAFKGIAILSFTKNAAKEIADRVNKFGGTNATQHPHFIGTIDSWLHGYILHPFGHKAINYKGKKNDKSFRIIDNGERYDFLNSFRTNASTNPYKDVWVNDYYYECVLPIRIQSQSRTLDCSTLSSDVKKILKANKKRFFTAGLSTYADAEFVCYFLLKENESILSNLTKRFPFIIIDECQDLSINQLEILRLLHKKGCIIHFVGDNNQSIYQFKKVYVEKINAFIKDCKFSELLLTKNFRSNQKIVDITMKIEKYNTGVTPNPIIGDKPEITDKSCILWEYDKEDFAQLPQKFIDHIKQINSKRSGKKVKIDITNCSVLARGHTTLSKFRSHPTSNLNKIELIANALNCWANTPRTGTDMQNALSQLGKSISMLAYNGNGNHVHQFCPETYTQIEWRNQLSDLITKAMNPANSIYPFKGVTWTVWVSNLKVFLEQYWQNLYSPENEWKAVKSKIKSPKGSKDKIVSAKIKPSETKYSEKIRMTTFHDVKGETLDAVLVVSSKDKKSKGGHYEHWLSESKDEKEYVRFAYVASSRPKHLLIWAIPKKENNSFIPKIIDLGFDKL